MLLLLLLGLPFWSSRLSHLQPPLSLSSPSKGDLMTAPPIWRPLLLPLLPPLRSSSLSHLQPPLKPLLNLVVCPLGQVEIGRLLFRPLFLTAQSTLTLQILVSTRPWNTLRLPVPLPCSLIRRLLCRTTHRRFWTLHMKRPSSAIGSSSLWKTLRAWRIWILDSRSCLTVNVWFTRHRLQLLGRSGRYDLILLVVEVVSSSCYVVVEWAFRKFGFIVWRSWYSTYVIDITWCLYSIFGILVCCFCCRRWWFLKMEIFGICFKKML